MNNNSALHEISKGFSYSFHGYGNLLVFISVLCLLQMDDSSIDVSVLCKWSAMR